MVIKLSEMKFMVGNGFLVSSMLNRKFWMYDFDLNTWSTRGVERMPVKLIVPGHAFYPQHDSVIFVGGGVHPTVAVNTVITYSVRDNSYDDSNQYLKDMPSAHRGPFCYADRGNLYAFGGMTSDGVHSNFSYMLRPSGNWERMGDVPSAAGHMNGFAVNLTKYVELGGGV